MCPSPSPIIHWIVSLGSVSFDCTGLTHDSMIYNFYYWTRHGPIEPCRILSPIFSKILGKFCRRGSAKPSHQSLAASVSTPGLPTRKPMEARVQKMMVALLRPFSCLTAHPRKSLRLTLAKHGVGCFGLAISIFH